MKAHVFILSVIVLSSGIRSFCQAQDTDALNNAPNTRFDVHREYDENGDLIYYDSVAVSTWGYDSSYTEVDSLMDACEYGIPNQLHPFHYGFHFPGDPFGYMPEFDFDFIIPDMHDLQEGFEYNYSITPSDSVNPPLFPDNPVFRHQHVVPPEDWNFDMDEEIYQMEQFIEDLNRRMEKEFYDPYYFKNPCFPEDSTKTPDDNPKPYKNSYDGKIIHI
jgi:hypothetical protein